MRYKLGLLLGFFFLAWGVAQAEFPDPRQNWMTLETAHFRVHFSVGLEVLAGRAAAIAEEAYATLLEQFGEAPTKIDLVIEEGPDFSNGFADPVGNRVVIFTSRLRGADDFNMRLGWLRMVIVHELVHMVDLTQARGPFASLRRIFGRIVAPNAAKPQSFTEGLAVYEKFKTQGESRLNDAHTRMVLRQMVLDERFPPLDQTTQIYSRRAWPSAGLLVYNYTSWFLYYLEATYGPKTLRHLSDGLSAGGDLEAALYAVTGKGLDALYDDFTTWLPQQFAQEIAEIRQAGVSPAQPLTHRGYYAGFPAVGPGGIAYVHSSPERSGLRLFSAEGDRELVSGTLASPSWAPEGRALVYSKLLASGQRDLFRYELASGRATRLTRGERAYAASYAPDGRIFYATNTSDGSAQLKVLRPGAENGEEIIDFAHPTLPHLPQGASIHSLAVSPDGKRLALVLQTEDGFQNLYLLELENLRLTRLTQDRYQDSDPSWSPDGQYILFSSDPKRIYNLYAYRLVDGQFFQVSNVLSGAFFPVMQGASLVFVGYGSEGYNLYRMPFDLSAWRPMERPSQPLAAEPAAKPLPERPYNSFALLAPHFWLPYPIVGGAGVYFQGADPIGQHSYAVIAGWNAAQGWPVYGLSYTNRQFPPDISLQLEGDGPYNFQRLGLDYSGFGLSYTRDASSPTLPIKHGLEGTYTTNFSWREEDVRFAVRLDLQGGGYLREGLGSWAGGEAELSGSLCWGWPLPITQAPGAQRVNLRLAGGYSGAFLVVDQIALGGPSGRFAVRGLDPGELVGPLGLVGSVQWDFLLARVERRLPIVGFVDDTWMGLFTDAGWTRQGFRYGFGLELGVSASLVGFQAGLVGGIAYSPGGLGPKLYANLAVPLAY
ncbi:WD40 domain protein beta Propeller [Allomeiothermus silvanus DSM 9946]|uniref:WD40 domain protein beta Propeller n=1 Tax=Allomeiothermus silvanus (strain ATCC 700542 / DSM 9946 / NBRC 106475 / NCIMB 13440 / VI-R2) TaxID=526227 RepID=D7BAE3_ALLS1|nr:PD40 domain-containing protein [Allomeiothermus silvanus]ADH64278.1 WD40 domain protein beta Propeller [Allomeiothermus silvanus DSM 9946]